MSGRAKPFRWTVMFLMPRKPINTDTSDKPVNKGGRPRKVIDWALVERLAKIQCTAHEIAAVVGVAYSTLVEQSEFSTLYKKASESGKASLRRTQFRHAEKSAAMAIYLGKVYLGQSDQPNPSAMTPEQLSELVAAIKVSVWEAV